MSHVAARQSRKEERHMAKKFKLIKPKAEEKTAAAGSKRTGAKVEKTKAGKREPGGGAGRYTGVTTGLSVTKYQNKTILDNMKAKKTDDEIAAMWRREFPNARAQYTAETVRGVRGLVNKGKHGNDAPSRPVPEFDESGDALPFRGEKSAAAREKREAKEAPAKKGKVKKSSKK